MSKDIINITSQSENALVKSLEGKPLDPILLGVANEYLKNTSINDIADQFATTTDVIVKVLDKKDVKSYIEGVYLTQGYMDRFKRMDIINKVINQKLEEALMTDTYSKKDLHDWLKLINQMEDAVRGKDRGPTVAVQVNNNYENLMKDLGNK